MPTRSRSHELEELSVARFKALLPAKWVSRAKLPDYGIDLEIEIFDAEGRSTGLTFLVQLRATDDANRADQVRLEADELAYWHQLDLLVMVARYCSATDCFHWQWASLISFRAKLSTGQQTTIYRFGESERWNDSTPGRINRTLEVRRALATFPHGSEMPVRLDVAQLTPGERYMAERSLWQAITQCAGALTRASGQRTVELDVKYDPDAVTLRIDTLTSIKIDHSGADAEEMTTSALYGATKLLSHKGLHRQAEGIARAILNRGLPHPAEALGLAACHVLAGDPVAVADLAILNGFHRQPVEGAAMMFEISRSPAPEVLRSAAADRFFAAALEAACDHGPTNVAAVHYSFANSLRAARSDRRALHHYNRARRLRPAYNHAAYFLREVGGVLFCAGRHRCAANAYRAARATDADALLGLLLGDALMLSGNIADAEREFEQAAAGLPPGVQAQEAELKRLTCEWLRRNEEYSRPEAAGHAVNPAMDLICGDTVEDWERVIRDHDALDPRAHFNLGVEMSRVERPADAARHFLACAFVQGGDIEAWANAALCAFGAGDADLLTAILPVAVKAAGPEVYDRLRFDLIGRGAEPDVVELLDTVASTVLGTVQACDPRSFTLRMLNGDGFEEMTIIAA